MKARRVPLVWRTSIDVLPCACESNGQANGVPGGEREGDDNAECKAIREKDCDCLAERYCLGAFVLAFAQEVDGCLPPF